MRRVLCGYVWRPRVICGLDIFHLVWSWVVFRCTLQTNEHRSFRPSAARFLPRFLARHPCRWRFTVGPPPSFRLGSGHPGVEGLRGRGSVTGESGGGSSAPATASTSPRRYGHAPRPQPAHCRKDARWIAEIARSRSRSHDTSTVALHWVDRAALRPLCRRRADQRRARP